MALRKLEIHTFNLYEKGKKSDSIMPDDIFGKDLFQVLTRNFPKFVDDFPPSKLKNKTTKIPKGIDGKSIFSFDSSKRYVYGKINIGDDNSKKQDVVLANKDKTYLYTKEIGHSVERPFFFMIILPENKKDGFLILEREGRHAMKSDFGVVFSQFVNELLSGLRVEFRNFIEQDIIKQWLTDGQYKEMIFTRKYLPNDKAETFLGDYQNDGKYDLRLSLLPKEGTLFPKITKRKTVDTIDSYHGFFESPELQNLGFDDNTDIKVVVDYEGNTRTIDLSDTRKVRPYYHVHIKEDANGFSNIESIKDEATQLINSFNLGIV